MSENEIYEKLNEIFRDVFDDEDITVTAETTSSDIEDWDSLTHISLMGSVEAEFGIHFAMKDGVGLKNVGELAAAIARELG